MTYTSRSIRRRRDTDKWEIALSHTNPLTGAVEPSYHTVTAKTETQARRKRDELIRELNLRDAEQMAAQYGYDFGGPYILGSQEPDSKPYQPMRLTREFKTFREANGFDCQFHDLRHTFATMLVARRRARD